MTLPYLDELIAEVDRRCDTAHHSGGQEQPDWLVLLTVAAQLSGQLQALADDLVEDYVEHCRMHGSSWTDIGTALGVTRQAVQQRFHAPHKRYTPEMMTDDLRQAMVHVKQAAVQHRNNYIGTEHLLRGLTAEDNSATRLLRAAGVSPEAVHKSVGARLSMGASQAAERIAWTPLLPQGDRHRGGTIPAERLRPHRLRRPADRPRPGRPRSGRRCPDRHRLRPRNP